MAFFVRVAFIRRYISVLIVLAVFCQNVGAQDSTIYVHGVLTSDSGANFTRAMIINVSTGSGVPANVDGTFSLSLKKSHKIRVFCRGYQTLDFSYADSTYQPTYDLTVEMKVLEVVMNDGVIIRPEVTPEDIIRAQEEINSNKYDPIVAPGLTSIASPISLLYQMFSKKEQEKREYIALLNQQAYYEAVKKVIYYFNDADLFYIDDFEMERFIDFCNMDPIWVKRATMYDVGLRVYQCYFAFERQREIERGY